MDDLAASGYERQPLVVGRGAAALLTAGFLDQVGLEPVLAGGPDAVPEPGAVVIWQPGLVLLERLGLRRPVETVGTPLSELECLEPGGSWSGDTSGRSPLVAVRREYLQAVVSRHLADRFRTTDRHVVSIEDTEGGVMVTFGGGIQESFDAVATTRRAVLPEECESGSSSLHWWSFEWPRTVSAPDRATEAWSAESTAIATPIGDSVRVDLLATGGAATECPLSLDALTAQFGDRSDSLADALAALEERDIQYSQTAADVPGPLCVDGTASVGPAAHASVPGDCLEPTLAIEDGWVLADALAYGPESATDALAAYAHRRRRRLVDVSSALREDALVDRVSPDLPWPLRQLCARRTLAFGHLFDSPGEELIRDVPDRL